MLDGFKKLPKMQFFKEGGHAKVKKMCGGGSYKEGGDVKEDLAQDKKMIKKAFKEHDKAEHDKKEPTEIKLKKGGRAKKDCGTVKKYKSGGEVMGVYKAKKGAEDDKLMDKAKNFKPKMIKEGGKIGSDVSKEKTKPSGDAVKMEKVKPTGDKKAEAKSGAKEMPNKYKKGGEVKKYADGRNVKANLQRAALMRAMPRSAQAIQNDQMAARAKNMLDNLGPAQQSEAMNQGLMNPFPSAPAPAPAPAAMPPAASPAMPPQDTMGSPTGMPAQKRGGKVKKMNTGGTAS